MRRLLGVIVAVAMSVAGLYVGAGRVSAEDPFIGLAGQAGTEGPIPDGIGMTGCGAPRDIDFYVPQQEFPGKITEVGVSMNLTHTYTQDVKAELIGPDGARVPVFTFVGGTGNFGGQYTFFDSAAISPSFSQAAALAFGDGNVPSGTYRAENQNPEGRLTWSFSGKTAAGLWRLRLTDCREGFTGSVNSGALYLRLHENKPDLTPNGNIPVDVSCRTRNGHKRCKARLYVSNIGDGHAECVGCTDGILVAIYRSDADRLADDRWGSAYIPRVYSGSIDLVTMKVGARKIPPEALVVVDLNNVIAERNESNNVLRLAVV